MFKFAMIALMTIIFMVTFGFAHPSSYGYDAPKATNGYGNGPEYGSQPAPIYGSGYDKSIYGAYEGHPGLYQSEKKAY
ncbi:hypothetical protein DAPPUDRAFT_233940 [Daphnia pulex]|uniref:Uncharacterized protein n=1 Tax=Daphnia pulex TaxID=6669 RepID=E9FW58_DAPPU|nr:hypothetical protein DAPPUDRAFT_233940 [Daphnia pulex]|eukprot:EFX88667.1 hypothetical protein DAPPUDRAFT_233940 [Daphnia pulex]